MLGSTYPVLQRRRWLAPRAIYILGTEWSSAVRRGLLEETLSPPVPPSPLPVRIQTMSKNDWHQVWSDSPTAPQIMRFQYIEEKVTLAGSFISSILYGTPPTRSSIRADFDRSVYSRGDRHAVLPMYGSPPQPRPSQRGGYQMVVRILHRGHVLVCDRVHRDEPPNPIRILYR